MKVHQFILEAIKPFKLYLIAPLMVVLFIALAQNFQSLFLKFIIDAFEHKDSSQLIIYSALFVSIPLIATIAWAVSDWAEARFQPRLKCHMRLMMLEQLKKYHHQFFQDNFSGQLANKINDTQLVISLINDFLYTFLYQGISFAIALIILGNSHPTIFFITLIFLVVFIGIGLYTCPKIVSQSSMVAEENSKISGHTVDFLGNMFSIKLFSSWVLERNKAITVQQSFIQASITARMYQQRLYIVLNLICVIYWVSIFSCIYQWYSLNTISAGDIALILSMIVWITEAQFKVFFIMREFMGNWGTVSQALAILEEPMLIQDKDNAPDLQVTKGKIVFDSVSFNYSGAEQLFENKSVIIESGQKVGLVGYSGSGKSTFVNLILRLFEPSSGHIYIDLQDIANVNQNSLREAIALIPQDPTLFHRSLIDNIRYAKPNATDEEVVQASQRAHAHEFIQNLPSAYDTLVGERGVKLSGGQRQRIAIARAILKNAPILILDEATSQLDSVTESYIQESLTELMNHKTTIVVAHRLSTLLHMDRILVFDKGKIKEDGSHQALLEQNGLYKQLWDAQVGGFLPDVNPKE